jgi:hypothetical protein
VEAAKAEAVARREKLALKPADKTDAAAQLRRLWRLDKFNALSDQERNALTADPASSLGERPHGFAQTAGGRMTAPRSL